MKRALLPVSSLNALAVFALVAAALLTGCVDHHQSRDEPSYDLADGLDPADGPIDFGELPDGSSLCGNGRIDPGEACDGEELGGQSCEGLGFEGGELSCSASCELVVDCSGCFDPYEPNNTFGRASLVSFPSQHSAAICSRVDRDFFAFEVPASGSRVMIVLNFEHGLGDLDMELLDPNGAVVQSAVGVLDVELIDHVIPPGQGGLWRVHVFGWNGATNTYELRILESCGDGDFRCGDGSCMPARYLCDGVPDCSDGADEAPLNPSCSPASELCANGRDDDGDGLIDCEDEECLLSPACVCGPAMFACPEDLICIARELVCDGVAHCRNGTDEAPVNRDCEVASCEFNLGPRFGPAIASGSTLAGSNRAAASCGGASAPEITHRWAASQTGCWRITTEGSDFDTVLSLYTACDLSQELACDDNSGPGNTSQLELNLSLNDQIVIAVDGAQPGSSGAYVLNIEPCAAVETVCTDGIDNDGDGRTDCLDPDCATHPACQQPENCTDGIDNDGDGRIDCLDPDCLNTPFCSGLELCNNFVDDDGDGLVDCQDPDCAGQPGCVPAGWTCFPEWFADGFCDCGCGVLDADCPAQTADACQFCDEVGSCSPVGGGCPGTIDPMRNWTCVPSTAENCTDGIDNDNDGRTDCLDPDCAMHPACRMCLPDGQPSPDPSACCNGDPDNNLICGFQGGLCLDPGAQCNLAQPLGQCCLDPCKDAAPIGFPGEGFCCAGDGFDYTSLPAPANVPYICCNGDPNLDGRCGGGSTPEVCTDGVDNDGDGRTDCLDPDCATHPACQQPENCTDGIDNDGDGRIDCLDPDCATHPSCAPIAENCQNQIDDDGDGLIDCQDPDCATHPTCGPTCPEVNLGMATGPNVYAGSTTLADASIDGSCIGGAGRDVTHAWTAPQSGCWRISTAGASFDTVLTVYSSCALNQELACDDDSGPGTTSQVDLTLAAGQSIVIVVDGFGMNHSGAYRLGITSCAPAVETVCTDGIDNDGDGRTDCLDPDCATHPACQQPENCTDGIDNDGDGRIDCLDPDCATHPSCAPIAENCQNQIDDDGDGLVDCADPDCQVTGACVETDCNNGLDDDRDGLIDCVDPDCTGRPACPPPGWSCPRIYYLDGLCDCGCGILDPDCSGPTSAACEYCNEQGSCNTLPACPGSINPTQNWTCIAVPEICNNGIDDNADGRIDCADPDCQGTPSCAETNCVDGIDNDGDGRIDCLDPDCAAAPVCIGGLTCPANDGFEPNNAPLEAHIFTSLPVFEQAILCNGEVDWYAVPAGLGQTVSVQIAFFNASGNLDLEVYDATTQSLLASSASTTADVEAVTVPVFVNTVLGIRVLGPGVTANSYTLDVQLF